MRTESGSRGDQPLLVAAFVTFAILRLGLTILKIKRRVNINRRRFKNELCRRGVPLNYARRLANEYGKEMSLRFWTRSLKSGNRQFLSRIIKKWEYD